MFAKILIANRGDNRSAAAVAAQTHPRPAQVTSQPHRRPSAARGDLAAEDPSLPRS
jgi:hypothetical protein